MTQRHQGRPREETGWRQGRPVEDPNKTKRWGYVTAKPSEFLVHCRRGKVLPTSGQGATCFKRPRDAIAIVPTSFQRLRFVADQVTSEKVGVQVTGIAVYRVAEPLLAFRVLNFSYPERAQEKLAVTLTEMLIGATRRLVANLSVDECLRMRKVALADELIAEIAPVVGGSGRPDDQTDKGWGAVLDTVEIQEVRVSSGKVFAAMQEPFRASLERQSREARAESEKFSALAEAASRRDIEQAHRQTEKHNAMAEAENKRDIEYARLDAEAAVRDRQVELARAEEETKTRDEILRIERGFSEERARVQDAIERHTLERGEIEAGLENHSHKQRMQGMRDELLAEALQHRLLRVRSEADVDCAVARQEAEVALARALVGKETAAARARVITAENLPALAAAVGARFGEVKVTQIGGSESPFSSIAQAVLSVLDLAQRD